MEFYSKVFNGRNQLTKLIKKPHHRNFSKNYKVARKKSETKFFYIETTWGSVFEVTKGFSQLTHLTITCLKPPIEILKNGVKSVQI